MEDLFTLKDPLILEIKGKDAKRYLNARLTNNIRDLSIGASCIAGMLNPQGRTEALLGVLHQKDGEFIVYCDGGDHEKVLMALKRYIVADRVIIDQKSPSWGVLHLYSTRKHAELINVPRKRGLELGVDLIGETSLLKKIEGNRLTEEQYTIRRIRAGILSFPEELNENTNFAEGDLDYAISFTKGCYVGQEVIEKVNAFGKVPRKITAKIVSGKILPNTEGEKALTCVYDQSADETIAFVSVLR